MIKCKLFITTNHVSIDIADVFFISSPSTEKKLVNFNENRNKNKIDPMTKPWIFSLSPSSSNK